MKEERKLVITGLLWGVIGLVSVGLVVMMVMQQQEIVRVKTRLEKVELEMIAIVESFYGVGITYT